MSGPSLQDRTGDLWIGTGTSLDRICLLPPSASGKSTGLTKDTSHINKTDSFRIYNYGEQHNIYNNISGILERADGKLWLATTTGILSFLPDRTPEPNPDLRVSRVQVFGRKDTILWPGDGAPRLSYDQNTLDIQYITPSYKNEREIKYSYFLDGLSTGWSMPSTMNVVRFAMLSPGAYTFKVKALKADGEWGDAIATFRFCISRPFWQTWYFYLLLILTVSLSLLAIYRYRMAQILKLQAVRNKISKDLHDDMGATLSSIAILSKMARDKMESGKTEQSQTLLTKIGDYAVEMVDKMADIVWAINPANDSMQSVIDRLKRFASEIGSHRNLQIIFESADDLQEHHLPMEARKNIYLICKEALINAIKYAEAPQIQVRFQRTDSLLTISVADNGKGFNLTTATKGNGLANMESRAEEIHGNITIRSALTQGTSIKLAVPLTDSYTSYH